MAANVRFEWPKIHTSPLINSLVTFSHCLRVYSLTVTKLHPQTSVVVILVDADKLFEHDLGALNMAALNRRVERAGLLRNLGPCCKALCARRDFAIRRQLLKNEKVCSLQLQT